MHALATWEQSPTFDPYNPNQIIREAYVGIPGGYGSFYFNRVPTKTALNGALGQGLSALPAWSQALIVGGLAATIGFFGLRLVGPKLKGLSGASRCPKGEVWLESRGVCVSARAWWDDPEGVLARLGPPKRRRGRR